MRTWMNVASVAKTKNLDGGLVVRSAAGLPFLLEEGALVAFVPPALDAPRTARVASVRPQADDEALVFFEGVDSIDVAERLAGGFCLMRRADVPADVLRLSDAPGWEGWTVKDDMAGTVGSVAGIEELPHQSMLLVERADAQGGIVQVPIVDEFIVDVDDEARVIRTNLPTGLLDL